MKLFSRSSGSIKERLKTRPVRTNELFVHYVRTGEYHSIYDGPLTTEGIRQSQAAADTIAERVTDDKVVVFGNLAYPTYQQTAEIIRERLHVPMTDMLFAADVADGSLFSLDHYFLRDGIRQFVLVLNGTALGDLLHRYAGPDVEIGFMGPDYGSVHTMRVEFAYQGASKRITTKSFV